MLAALRAWPAALAASWTPAAADGPEEPERGEGLRGCPEAEPWPGLARELRRASEALALGSFHLARDVLAVAAEPFVADARQALDCTQGVAALFRALAYAHCSDPRLEGRALRRANHVGLRFLYLAMTWLTYAGPAEPGSGGGRRWPVDAQALHDDIVTVSDALRSTGAAGHVPTPMGRAVPHDLRRPELRIALASLCAYPEGHPLPGYAASNHGLYAEAHGYAHLLDPRSVDPSRPPAWGKVRLVERALRSGLWDWVVWADCDTYFMNMSATLESILFAYAGRGAPGTGPQELELDEGVHLVLSEDGALLNTGVFFARSGGWAAALLERVWGGEDSPWTWHPWWDQAAFAWELLRGNARRFALEDYAAPPTDGPPPDELAGVYPPQVRVVSQESFNSYHPTVAGSLHDAWEQGKFVLAFHGMTSASSPSEARAAYRHYYHEACRLNALEHRCMRDEEEVAPGLSA